MNISIQDFFNSLFNYCSNTIVTNKNGELIALQDGFNIASDLVFESSKKGKKVIVLGNGGSAAIASHVQNDLCKGSNIRAMVLHEPSLLTALSNDIAYKEAYPILVRIWAEYEDILIAISSSGSSSNIIDAAEIGITKMMKIITFSGFSESNPLRLLGDVNFYTPSDKYGEVEIVHATLTHYFTDSLKMRINGD